MCRSWLRNPYQSPPRVGRFTVLAVLVVAFCPGLYASRPERRPESRDYYVSAKGNDSGNGSVAHPWATIQRAAAAARAGVTIHVAPGKYSGPIVTEASGTGEAPVRYISEQRWGATISGPSGQATWSNSGSYAQIEGFDLTGPGCIGIANSGAHVRIARNHVHDLAARDCGDNGGAGIDNVSQSAVESEIVANMVNQIGDCRHPNRTVHGIYHSSPGGRIRNNLVIANQGWGIHLWHGATHVEIANNLVYGNGYGGIVVGAGESPVPVINEQTIVSNNIVMRNGYGIMEFGNTGSGNRYLNNIVYSNTSTALMLLTGVASGTINANPRFLLEGTDFHLLASSPAIDAGTPEAGPEEDFDGNSRPQLKGWDIGPYEWTPQATATASEQAKTGGRR